MSEENKIEEVEEVKEINPIDEYLSNYKEHKLAEFCVQKDREIEGQKKEIRRIMEHLIDTKRKAEKYDKTFGNIKELYSEIKKLSIDEYLELYHMISKDVSGCNNTSITATLSTGLGYGSNSYSSWK